MYWNLILAAIPILFGYLSNISNKWWWIWIVPWLVFLPNSFYVWTDIIHPFGVIQYACPNGSDLIYCDQELIRQIAEPRWDGTITQIAEITVVLCAIFLASWYGTVAWNKIVKRFSNSIRMRLLIAFSILCAFGITLGRFARTNSWYLITHPMRVVEDTIDTIKNILTSGVYTGTFAISIIWVLITVPVFTWLQHKLDFDLKTKDPL